MPGAADVWLLVIAAGAMSSVRNSTAIVVLTAPVVKDVAETLHLSAKRFLMPLSCIAILGGCCTLLGTSTDLLVDDMARVARQSRSGRLCRAPSLATFVGAILLTALIVLDGLAMVRTELLSNATIAVLVTPIAIALAESLGVSPRPFLVVVMIAGSASFATPFGYQTKVIVSALGKYRYTDFLRVGLPLNLSAAVVAILSIRTFFPF